jgi:hypothetical protein
MRNIKKMTTVALTALLGLALVGCNSNGSRILPSSSNKNQTTWANYAEAKLSFDDVALNKTRRERLAQMGFDPTTIPNVKILNYVDIVNLFGSSFSLADLPEGVKTCVKARENCTGYVVVGQDIRNKRGGNVMADLFGFRRQTMTSGWDFNATFVMVDDLVVYKLWNGRPKIESTDKQVTPLGPMQSWSGMIPKPF